MICFGLIKIETKILNKFVVFFIILLIITAITLIIIDPHIDIDGSKLIKVVINQMNQYV